MQDKIKIMQKIFIKNNLENNLKNKIESGYILAFSLIIVAITLSITIAVTRIIYKELFFSRIIDSSKEAYAAAAAGIECAQYLDSTFVNFSTSSLPRIFLNSTSTGQAGKNAFDDNLTKFIFTTEIANGISERTGIAYSATAKDLTSKIFCASDGSYNQSDGSYNQMFWGPSTGNIDENMAGYVLTSQAVLDNLNKGDNAKTSYNISGTANNATTTFGLVLKSLDSENDLKPTSCVLVKYAKTKSSAGNTTDWSITSTGYSSCNGADKNRVSRTIQRFSNQ